ncbi:MAG: hypothetical protein HWE13_09270 [Gammaproteobacteria bacterium]|nr:hypothetical protein [Gammaproteobacteria bacterium]NVK88305.1 hypothetical protein [Gammaproteobacteria bacterium]
MPPITVKAYGILELTKKQYLAIQAFGFCFLFIFVFWFHFSGFNNSEIRLVRYLGYVAWGVIILEVVETWFMLRRFRTKAQARRDAAAEEN